MPFGAVRLTSICLCYALFVGSFSSSQWPLIPTHSFPAVFRATHAGNLVAPGFLTGYVATAAAVCAASIVASIVSGATIVPFFGVST